MKSLYDTPEHKAEIHQIYQQKLDELDIEYRFKKVKTSFGETNIIVTGDPENPPLVLIHGSNGCAPIGLGIYPNLTQKYQVFAVDVIAQPNLSAETRPSMKDNSYGKWMNEVISSLYLEAVVLVGFSLGGFVIWKTLLENEDKVLKAFLVAPVGIVNGNPLKLIWNVFIPMKRYMKTQKNKFLEKFLSTLFTERDEFAIRFLSKVFVHFEMDFSPIPTIKPKDASGIQTPITIFGAKKDLMGPGDKLLRKAGKIFPSLKKGILLENSKHVQGAADNERVEKVILDQ